MQAQRGYSWESEIMTTIGTINLLRIKLEEEEIFWEDITLLVLT